MFLGHVGKSIRMVFILYESKLVLFVDLVCSRTRVVVEKFWGIVAPSFTLVQCDML